MGGLIDYLDKITIGASKAAKIAGVSRQTVYNWYYQFGIGRKIAGRIRIDPAKLDKLIREENFVITKKKIRNELKAKSFSCPFGYFFGRDYDNKPRCKFCNRIVWLHCGDKNDQYNAMKQYKRKGNKLYDNEELEEKIKEMEKRLKE